MWERHQVTFEQLLPWPPAAEHLHPQTAAAPGAQGGQLSSPAVVGVNKDWEPRVPCKPSLAAETVWWQTGEARAVLCAPAAFGERQGRRRCLVSWCPRTVDLT